MSSPSGPEGNCAQEADVLWVDYGMDWWSHVVVPIPFPYVELREIPLPPAGRANLGALTRDPFAVPPELGGEG